MIMGYAQNGSFKEAMFLFQEMIDSGILPTSVTFVGVLFACSHAGLVEEGRNFYKLMVYTYGIPPSVEHCACMVDLLGRAGYLEEAETFLLDSPFREEPGIWGSLLAACGVYNNSDVGSRAAQHCLWLEPRHSSTYTLLSNIYASSKLWNDVTRIRDLMKEKGVEKEPGFSCLRVDLACNEDLITAQAVFLSHVVFTNISRQIQTNWATSPIFNLNRCLQTTTLPCLKEHLMKPFADASRCQHFCRRRCIEQVAQLAWPESLPPETSIVKRNPQNADKNKKYVFARGGTIRASAGRGGG
ncbi:unnamed protein product [Camellia sinensis]